MSSDTDQIRQTCLDYLEGWYSGDADRMQRALHADLSKKGYQILPATKRPNLVHLSAVNMVEYTRAEAGKQKPDTDLQIEITVHDIGRNIATARASSLKFVDYVQLARLDDRWQIVNVLWEPKDS